LTLLERWRSLARRLLPELTKFGIVGAVCLVIDVGGFNLLRYAGSDGPLHDAPLTAKFLSAATATVASWLGNRYWTFRHGRRSAPHREFMLFVLMCSLGTGIAMLCLGTSHYVLGLTSPLADNVSANVIGLALGTSFRFWAYRTHVFSEHRRRTPPATVVTSEARAYDAA
jgi:putative flippase GtrA